MVSGKTIAKFPTVVTKKNKVNKDENSFSNDQSHVERHSLEVENLEEENFEESKDISNNNSLKVMDIIQADSFEKSLSVNILLFKIIFRKMMKLALKLRTPKFKNQKRKWSFLNAKKFL